MLFWGKAFHLRSSIIESMSHVCDMHIHLMLSMHKLPGACRTPHWPKVCGEPETSDPPQNCAKQWMRARQMQLLHTTQLSQPHIFTAPA